MDLRPTDHIASSDRKIGGSGAIESFPRYLKSTITPLTKEFRVDLDETLGMPDVVIVNGSRFMPEIEPDNSRRPTLADVNGIRVSLAQRITEADNRSKVDSRSSHAMRYASDMLGYLSRELVAQDRRLFEMRVERDSARGLADQADGYLRRAETAEAALNAQAETSAKLSTMAPVATGEVAETLAMLERSAVWFEDKSTGENPESARLLRQTATLVGRLEKERDTALAQVTALSQPRIVNVAGLVDADLAERYESLRQSCDLVNAELKRLRRPVSGVSLYREIDALGGTFDPDDLEAVGHSNALDEVISILEKRGYTEHADPAPIYSDGDREKAAQAFHDDPLAARDHAFEPGTPRGDWCFEVVDCVAGSLGMRRAGA